MKKFLVTLTVGLVLFAIGIAIDIYSVSNGITGAYLGAVCAMAALFITGSKK